jgi:LuxR family maltose regulon positive regulatory protein
MSARPLAFTSPSGAAPSPLARGLVGRPRLLERLQSGTEGPVTLLSAPAGSGKTLLVGSWLRDGQPPGPVAWVSVERDEQDATRFWSMVIRGLAASGTEVGEALEALVPTPETGQDELLGRLLEWLQGLRAPIVLVPDDLHHHKALDARRGLQQLLGRAPPQLRMVLISRRDPRLGLHRRRVAGELTEIRAAELEFTIDEASELLRLAGVELSDRDVALLRERTVGWAAGLRLAVMRLVGQAPFPSSYPSAPCSTGTTPRTPGAPNLAHLTCTSARPPATCPCTPPSRSQAADARR